MFKIIKNNWMAFTDIFKNENDFNEKTIVGFLSFTMMTIFAFADIFTGLFGKDLVIQEFIYYDNLMGEVKANASETSTSYHSKVSFIWARCFSISSSAH